MVGTDHVELVRMPSEDIEHATQQVGRGLVARDQKQHREEEQLVIVDRATGIHTQQLPQDGVRPLQTTDSELPAEIAEIPRSKT